MADQRLLHQLQAVGPLEGFADQGGELFGGEVGAALLEHYGAVGMCVVDEKDLRVTSQQAQCLHVERPGAVLVQREVVGDGLHLILRQGEVEADALLRPFAVALQIVFVALQIGLLGITHQSSHGRQKQDEDDQRQNQQHAVGLHAAQQGTRAQQAIALCPAAAAQSRGLGMIHGHSLELEWMLTSTPGRMKDAKPLFAEPRKLRWRR